MEKYIGKVLNDRYMITEVVGVGGMAYVFKAFDKVCNRVVAVKVLKDEFMSDAQFRRRFTNESKAITMLSHNNIVDVYDVSLEGDALYIVMEYIDGITLKEYMDKKGVLTPNEALHFLKQILNGLSHAHERGIVHRDIKPHNIVLLKDGTIKITDFGIARLTKFDTQTMSDMAIGSVHYISPEQASGDRTDARSDIYSVGIILYEMLTAKLPFEADTAVAVALMQVQAQPDLPSEINREIPQGLEDIILKAIMKDPAIRYQSAAAILADIALFEADPTITFDYLVDAEDEVKEDIDNSPTISAIPIREMTAEPEELQSAPEILSFDEGEEQVEDVKENKFKTTWLPIIAGVGSAFLILILIALAIVFQKSIFSGGSSVSCPYVVGMTVEDAKKEFDDFAFVVESTVASDEYKEGEIISQNPKADEEMDEDEKIKVVVSSGEASNEDDDKVKYVPDVVKKSLADAKKAFDNEEIEYNIVRQNDEDIEKDHVISTDPKAGREVSGDDVVTIVVSDGPEKKDEIEMPDLTGLSLEIAKTTLTNNKLFVGNVTEEYHDTIAAGCVINQSVKKGEKAEENSKIDLVVSKGKEPADMVTMPDLSNLSLEVAQTTLKNNKLVFGNYTEQYSESVPAGYVIFQSVAKNTQVAEGTAINLVISRGPESTDDTQTGTDVGGDIVGVWDVKKVFGE